MSNELASVLVPPEEDYGFYHPLDRIQDGIHKHLKERGEMFYVHVAYTGPTHSFPRVILATSGNSYFRGPPLEEVQGVKDDFIREWLEDKGNLPPSLVRHFLTLFTGVLPKEYQWEVRVD